MFLFFGTALAFFFVLGTGIAAVVQILHLPVRNRMLVLLPGQFLMYGFVFAFLLGLFRLQYGKPFWQSLRWFNRPPAGQVTAAWGVATAFAVALLGAALKTPDLNSPMKELLSDPVSLAVVGLLGITIGPIAEEIVFRGFLQPLFVRSLGPWAGVALAALLFGALHLQEYGNSWRHGLLISAAGAAFGWMRYRTGSTRSAAIMHAAYNGTFFAALLMTGRK